MAHAGAFPMSFLLACDHHPEIKEIKHISLKFEYKFPNDTYIHSRKHLHTAAIYLQVLDCPSKVACPHSASWPQPPWYM